MRGIVSLYTGGADQATGDINRAAEFAPNLIPAVLWQQVVSGRKSQLVAFAARTDLTPWPGPLVRLMLGEVSLDNLLAGADDLSATQRTRNICQGSFWAGELKLLEGARDQAKGLIERAAATCPQTFIEWFAANAELKTL